jgi:hypothetical protein
MLHARGMINPIPGSRPTPVAGHDVPIRRSSDAFGTRLATHASHHFAFVARAAADESLYASSAVVPRWKAIPPGGGRDHQRGREQWDCWIS